MKDFIIDLKDRFEIFCRDYSWNDFYEEFGRSNIPVTQNPAELKVLIDVYRRLSPKNIVEIGQDFGGTLYYFLKFRTDDSRIIAIDANHKRVLSTFSKWDIDSKDVFFIEGDSKIVYHESKNLVNDIDFAFIDGGHDYDTVKTDFLNVLDHMKSGVICLHDIHLGTEAPGVPRLWKEILSDSKLKSFEFSFEKNETVYNLGLGIVFKKED